MTYLNKSKPKISVFLEYFPPLMGSDSRIYEIMKKLARKNFEINFIVLPPLRGLAGAMDESLEHHHFSYVERSPEGIAVSYIDVPVFIKRLWKKSTPIAYLLTLFMCSFRCLSNLKQNKPDVVVLAHPSYLCGLTGLISAKFLNLNIVLDYPDLWTPMTLETLSWSATSLRSIILEKVEQQIVKFSDKVIAITTQIHKKVIGLGVNHTKTSVIPNGIPLSDIIKLTSEVDKNLDKLTHRKRVVLYSGRLERWTNLEALIKSSPHVLSHFPNAIFIIMGDGTWLQTLKKMVTALGVQKNFVFTGYVKRDKVWESILNADVCISTLSDSITSDSALPLKILEYAAMGRPMVVTKNKSITKLLRNRENALLVNPNDSKSMAVAISLLLNNQSLANSIGLSAKNMIQENFDWDHLASRFGDVCLSTIAK